MTPRLPVATAPSSATTRTPTTFDGRWGSTAHDDQHALAVAARFLAGYSGHTAAAYRRDLRSWFTWCREHEVPVLAATRSTIDLYARQLADPAPASHRRPASATTIARHLACLSGYYRYAVSEDAVAKNPVEHVRRPRTSRESPSVGLDREEVGRLLEQAERHSPRGHALAAVLVYTGARITEVLAADVTDLETTRGHSVLRVIGKGGHRRLLVVPPPALAPLTAYLDDRLEGPLFCTRTGGRFDRSEAWRLVRALARAADIPSAGRIGPHTLRHTFVTLAREAGVPLEDVQDAAGHADPRTTRRYDRARHNLERSPGYALAGFLSPRT